MVFFQLNVTGLLFQSFRTASPICNILIISVVKSLTVKLLPLVENFFYSNFASVKSINAIK